MGKQKIKVKRKYGRREFIDIICQTCGLCGNDPDPFYCFDTVYSKHRKKFIKKILPQLISMRKEAEKTSWPFKTRYVEEIRKLHEEIFCGAEFCGPCKNKMPCQSTFVAQIKGENPVFKVSLKKKIGIGNNKEKNKSKSNKGKKKRWIAEPYPTFFCNPEFEKEIERTLSDNNDFKSNKGAGDSSASENKTNKTASNVKP